MMEEEDSGEESGGGGVKVGWKKLAKKVYVSGKLK